MGGERNGREPKGGEQEGTQRRGRMGAERENGREPEGEGEWEGTRRRGNPREHSKEREGTRGGTVHVRTEVGFWLMLIVQ